MDNKNEFLFDLKTPETTWKGPAAHSYFPNGQVSSDVGSITAAEGEHGLYWCLDSVMHKNPEGMDHNKTPMPHFHWKGYETFFVDSGSLYLYIDGMKALAKKGDIVHLQAGQSQGMFFLDDVKWRGTYHDFFTYPEAGDVGRVKRMMPELADDPELNALSTRGFMDSNPIEPFLCKEVPTEQCPAIKNPDRPHASYEFPGVSMRIVVERWENGGVKELDCAIMEPGFTATWVKYPPLRELFYLRKGKVKFTMGGKEFIADDECVINAPRFLPRSIEVLEKAEMYDLGGQPYWSLFLQNIESIRHYDPSRLTKETIDGLKKRFKIQIESIGFKG